MMNDPALRDLLNRLEEAERQLADRRQPSRRTPQRSFTRRITLGIVALLVALVPLSLLAADPTFSDLGDAAAVHQPNIQAIGNAGITTGFEDPNNTSARLYNPKGQVTREEMASFLARTAGLGGNPLVVNANTAVTANSASSADRATNADTATNANLLNNQPGSYYQPAGQPIMSANNAVFAATAGDANTVGGIPASALVRSNAAFVHRATAANTSGYITTIDNPLTNGRPDALLFVTHNYNPGAVCPCVYNPHPLGVYYVDGKWAIYNEDFASILVNSQFNVLAIQP